MANKRDLKKDLEMLMTPKKDGQMYAPDIKVSTTGIIAREWLERAIDAEEELAKLKLMAKKKEAKDE